MNFWQRILDKLRRKPVAHVQLAAPDDLADLVFGPGKWRRLGLHEPYAKFGEQVTCENGHMICRFTQRVSRGQICDVENQIGYWTQAKPTVGQLKVSPCAKCGARWWVEGNVFHFADGWRVL